MNLTELYKAPSVNTEKAKFRGNDIEVKLLLEDEAVSMENRELSEQLAMCIVEDGKTILEAGKQDIFKNMPLAHKKELMEVVMKANGINVSFDEKKSD